MVAHLAFEIVALADDVPGEVFFAVPLSAVGFLEAVELVVELHVVIDGIEVITLAGQVVMRVPQIDDGAVVEVPSGMYYVRSRQTRTPIPVIVR